MENIEEDMHLAKEILNLPKLEQIPLELQRMIRALSNDSLIWQYSSVQRLSRRVIGDDYGQFPLSQVFEWNRGEAPVNRGLIQEPLLRLTIDSWGLRQIERIGMRDEERGQGRRGDMVFILQQKNEVGGTLDLKAGLGRLILPSHIHLKAWDVPRPFPLKNCLVEEPDLRSVSRFGTINTERHTGMTIFLHQGHISAIHAHSSAEPTALKAFN
jgi:hypothetical protein